MTLGQDCLFRIPSAAVQALVDGRHGDPFSILGPHQCGSMSVVRVLAVADFGGTGVSDCAVGNTARDTSGLNPSLSATT